MRLSPCYLLLLLLESFSERENEWFYLYDLLGGDDYKILFVRTRSLVDDVAFSCWFVLDYQISYK